MKTKRYMKRERKRPPDTAIHKTLLLLLKKAKN